MVFTLRISSLVTEVEDAAADCARDDDDGTWGLFGGATVELLEGAEASIDFDNDAGIGV